MPTANHPVLQERPDLRASNQTNPEHIPVSVFQQPHQASAHIARQIADLIQLKAELGQSAVLGLATGSTPVSVYDELVRLHQEEGLSFANVVTFNLDEYLPMQPDSLQSYHRFMHEHLFDRIDIDPNNCHVPDGTLNDDEIAEYCQQYEEKIRAVGGIDIQLLGIGRTGHVGFNEPGSSRNSRTRMIWLDKLTRLDAASDFFGIEHVPTRAITMGVGTILDARRVLLMAWGEGKSTVVAQAVEGPITPSIAASYLQQHPSACFVLDEAAAADLTRSARPWSIGEVDWTPSLIRKAVIWLAQQTNKAILKLTDEDYNEHGLQSLIAHHGPAYDINLQVFRAMQATITGWPATKDEKKRVVIFSPHPDDDVISMGGTLIRLADQEHEVHVAYQVSGNIAVFDEDAMRFVDFANDFNRLFGIDSDKTRQVEEHLNQFLHQKNPGQVDSEQVQLIKGTIRRGEARAAGRSCGLADEHMHFLDMPFYETGTIRKKPIGEQDIQIIVDLLKSIKPHQIYAAGDLSDPHGTHRTCLMAIFQACERLHTSTDWMPDTDIWLYRGAWQEWAPEQIEMAVPLSPGELQRKRAAIFKHESQKDRALFPGIDAREFWQRAEDRNRATAHLYDKLGLAEYEAIEGFVRWVPDPSRNACP